MKFALYVSLIVGIGSLALGAFAEGRITAAYWILALGLVWLIAEIRRVRWVSSFGFLACVFASAYGLWIGLSASWMLAGALGALIAWDLSDFLRRLADASPDDETSGLIRRHLIRLLIVTAAGLAFSLIGIFLRLQFSFEWTAFLAILSALGVSLLIRRMRERNP